MYCAFDLPNMLICPCRNKKRIGAVIKVCKLPIKLDDLHLDQPQETIKALMGKWLPISTAVLDILSNS